MDNSLYTRPDKPRTMTVTKRRGAPARALPDMADVISVDRFSECHVTPLDVARRMVEYLGEPGDFPMLEPSAGTGNLIQALYDSGYSRFELVAVERHVGLCQSVYKRFKGDQTIKPINDCFLDYAKQAHGKIEFPRIIMNPPFRKVKQHMKAALSLLGTGGHSEAVLVALVPITYFHDDMELMEELPNTTFTTAKVSTKIIRFAY